MSSAEPLAGWRGELRWWKRFPTRLSVFYGTLSLLLMAALSLWFANLQFTTSLRNIQERLLALVVEVSIIADGTKATGDDAEVQAAWDAVGVHMERVLAANRRVKSIYALRTTDRPGHFEFLADHSRPDDPSDPDSRDEASFLEPYDATGLATMRRGLDGPLVEDRLYADAWGLSLSAYAPIHDASGRVVGIVGADIEADDFYALRRRIRGAVLSSFAAGLAGLIAITWVARGQLDRPLAAVIDASRALARGDLGARVGLDRDDEFGLLGRSFDAMAAGLEERERIRTAFGRFMSRRLANVLLDADRLELGGAERDVTVMFSDLRGYSTIAEHADPVDVLLLLNEYLTSMLEVIDAHEGVVIEFLGDGILAVFGAPLDLPDHPDRAVACALGMRERLVALNRQWDASGRSAMWRAHGLDGLQARIGLHCGRVVAGNLGSEERMKYGVIGDTVNVAARLEQLNKQFGTDILVSADLRDRLTDPPPMTSRGEVTLKGRGQAGEVFSL